MSNKHDKMIKRDAIFPNIGVQQKLAFIVTIIGMLTTHFYMFLNKIINHDDVNRLLVGDTDAAKIQHGRWAGVIFDHVSGSSVSIPYIIGMISTLSVAAACVVLISLLDVRKRISIVLICLLICTFPVSANIFLYNYIADIYFISLFLALWGIWLIRQTKWWQRGAGIILLTLSCGCYQAFWCVGIGVLFICFLFDFLEEKEDKRVLGKKAIKCIVMAGTSMALYLAINKVIQGATGFDAIAYQGLNTMGKFQGLLGMIKVIIVTYFEFLSFFYIKGFFTNSLIMIIINIILTFLTILMFVKKGREKRRTFFYWMVVLLIICTIPIASNLISIASQNQTHVLMQYALLLPYIICLVLLEYDDKKEAESAGHSVIRAATYFMIICVIYKGYVTDNEIYFRQQLNYEATYSYTLRLLYRIEEFEGYTPDMKIALINETPQINDHITIMQENYPDDMEYFEYLNDMVGTEPRTFVKRANDISDFCKYYHGYDLKLTDINSLPDLAETDEFLEMDTYPRTNGMKIINGVLVIKLPDGKTARTN